MTAAWPVLPFTEVVEDVSGGQPKTLARDFLTEGRYPLVDQGQDLIGGYTDEEARLATVALPAIVFGDHTRVVKYVDFPFGVGADGVKLLRPRGNLHVPYLFRYLQAARIPATGYDRHFKYLKRIKVPVPPIEEQRRIAAVLHHADELRAKRQTTLDLIDSLAESIFLDMFGDPRIAPDSESVPMLEVVEDRSAGQPKTLARDFVDEGTFPLVDQGQDLIGGYTNDTSALCDVPLPVIVFGDHTRVLKFVDFVFGVGADGVKILRPRQRFNPRYAFHALRLLRLSASGYARHFKFLKDCRIPDRPRHAQDRFAAQCDAIASRMLKYQEHALVLDELFVSLQQRAFAGPL